MDILAQVATPDFLALVVLVESVDTLAGVDLVADLVSPDFQALVGFQDSVESVDTPDLAAILDFLDQVDILVSLG